MSYSTKYSLKEREIVRAIHRLQDLRNDAEKRYHFYDMKVGIFIKKLNGKYEPRKS